MYPPKALTSETRSAYQRPPRRTWQLARRPAARDHEAAAMSSRSRPRSVEPVRCPRIRNAARSGAARRSTDRPLARIRADRLLGRAGYLRAELGPQCRCRASQPACAGSGLSEVQYDPAASFGLIGADWSAFRDRIAQLNAGASASEAYKGASANLAMGDPLTIRTVFFVARHGQGWHNVAESTYGTPEWDCYWCARRNSWIRLRGEVRTQYRRQHHLGAAAARAGLADVSPRVLIRSSRPEESSRLKQRATPGRYSSRAARPCRRRSSPRR